MLSPTNSLRTDHELGWCRSATGVVCQPGSTAMFSILGIGLTELIIVALLLGVPVVIAAIVVVAVTAANKRED